MRLRLVIAMVIVGVLGAGCSSDTDEPGSAKESPEATGRSSAEPATGETKNVSVASIVLPDSAPWTEKPVQSSDSVDEVEYLADFDENQVPSCRATLGVERLEEGMEVVRVRLEALGADSITVDSEAPDGVEGLLGRFSGPKDAGSTGKPFTSTVRYWLTDGGTLITTTQIVANGDSICEPDEIVASLTWSGEERPAAASAG